MHHIQVINQSNKSFRHTGIRAGIQAALELAGIQEGSVTVLLADDAELRRLNREFRQIDEATDVLTFPAPTNAGDSLGDIAISVDFVERGAAKRKVSLSQEAAYLAIHGALHLAGRDDQTEADYRQMIQEMNFAAEKAGLKPDHEWQSLPHGDH